MPEPLSGEAAAGGSQDGRGGPRRGLVERAEAAVVAPGRGHRCLALVVVRSKYMGRQPKLQDIAGIDGVGWESFSVYTCFVLNAHDIWPGREYIVSIRIIHTHTHMVTLCVRDHIMYAL